MPVGPGAGELNEVSLVRPRTAQGEKVAPKVAPQTPRLYKQCRPKSRETKD